MLIPPVTAQTPDNTDPVPVAPIPVTEYKGWSNAYTLGNEAITVVVAPEIGRIVHLSWSDEPNLLRLNPDLLGETGQTIDSDDWINFGGDWIWPAAQPQWPLFQEDTWPPSHLLDGSAWTGRAWRTEDGTRHSMMTKDFDAPLHVRVHRTLRLDRERPSLAVRQRLERTDSSDIPVTLWQLSQIKDATHVVIPIDDESRFERGLKPLLFERPEADLLHYCGNTAVYRAGLDGEHKLGSDSQRQWIAALKGHTLIIQRSESGAGEGPYPDGGCRIEMFANADLGYVEIESLHVEQVLEKGQYMDNTLHIELHRLDRIPETPCALAAIVQQLVGELPSPEAVPTESDLIE